MRSALLLLSFMLLGPGVPTAPRSGPGSLAALPGGFELAAQEARPQDAHLVVIVGLGGDPAHEATFHGWATDLLEAARTRHGIPEAHLHYLGEDPDRDPSLISMRSTRDNVRETLARIGAQAGPADLVTVLVIGHGSERDGEVRVNLPGPDLTAGEFAEILDGLGDRPLTVIQTTSASGGFVEPLSREGRVILTATRSGRESNEPRFPEYLVSALAGDGADTDKDGRVSMLEAFTFARMEVARVYERAGTLRTEHAILDDDGDGVGSEEPPVEGGDGQVARRRFLSPGSGGPVMAADPELAALYARRDSIQGSIDQLQAVRDALDPEEYDRRLEELLVEMALVRREIRAREGGGAP